MKRILSAHSGLRRAALLCATAGYVDAYGYLGLGGVFPANMTGSTVLLGIALARLEAHRVAIFAMTLGAFFLGAIIASLLKRIFARPPLAFVIAAILLLVADTGTVQSETKLILLASAMGMQGASLARFNGISMRTVVVTGTMLQIAEAIAGFTGLGRASGATPSFHDLAIPAAGWLTYALGAGISAALAGILPMPMIVPAFVLVLIAADLALHPNTP